jgi:hypothetical protein
VIDESEDRGVDACVGLALQIKTLPTDKESVVRYQSAHHEELLMRAPSDCGRWRRQHTYVIVVDPAISVHVTMKRLPYKVVVVIVVVVSIITGFFAVSVVVAKIHRGIDGIRLRWKVHAIHAHIQGHHRPFRNQLASIDSSPGPFADAAVLDLERADGNVGNERVETVAIPALSLVLAAPDGFGGARGELVRHAPSGV